MISSNDELYLWFSKFSVQSLACVCWFDFIFIKFCVQKEEKKPYSGSSLMKLSKQILTTRFVLLKRKNTKKRNKKKPQQPMPRPTGEDVDAEQPLPVLPEELILKILRKLLVKSLLNFSCLSSNAKAAAVLQLQPSN